MIIKQQLLSDAQAQKVSWGTGNPRNYITVHQTGNPRVGANAQMHADLQSRGFTHGWQWSVDDKMAIQSIDHKYKVWHAGDQYGKGNTESIGVEICINQDGNYNKAVDNGAKLVAKLMQQENIPISKVVQHNYWSGKDCPKQIRAGKNGITWGDFKNRVQKYYDELTEPSTKTPIASQEPTVSMGQMRQWCKNSKGSQLFYDLVPTFYKVGLTKGIDPALLYAQSAKETAFMKFGGVLDASFKNPCGMKTTKGGGNYDPDAHQRFSTWEEGIIAQADHLNLYAGAEGYPLKDTPDPRHFEWIQGTAKTVEALGGKWAGAANYGTSIVDRMQQIQSLNVGGEEEQASNASGEISKEEKELIEETEHCYMFDFGIAYPSMVDHEPAQDLANWLRDKGYKVHVEDTTEMRGYDIETVIQVGSSNTTVNGRDILIAGENRADTSLAVSKWKMDNDKSL